MFSFLYHSQDFYWTWLCIWVTRRVSYKKQELRTLREHLSSPLVFLVGSVLLIFLVFYVVLFCVFTFWVPCCDVYYDFFLKWCSVRFYLQLFIAGLMSYLHYLCLFVHSGVKHILRCIFLRLAHTMLPVSLDCPFLIAPSVFSNFYFIIMLV